MSIDYDQLSETLGRLAVPCSAAEAHGLICGMAVAAPDQSDALWADELFEDFDRGSADVQAAERLLQELFEQTVARLTDRDMQFDFGLLLPEDEAELDIRASELGVWCQGFLYGFGVAGGRESDFDGDEASGILVDLQNISQLDDEEANAGEETEAALMEVESYVEAAVQLLFANRKKQHELH